MKKVNDRTLALAHLLNKFTEEVLNELKTELRNGAELTNYGYAGVDQRKHTQNVYTAEDQAKIDTFIKEQGIEKVSITKENHTMVIQASETAKREYDKIVNLLAFTDNDAIVKVASKLMR